MSVNKVMLIGFVGSQPEIKYGENNSKISTFRLAVSEKFTDRNGERKEVTEWVSVVAFGKPADVIEKYVNSGSQIYVEGKIRTRQYTGRDGAKINSTGVLAENVQLLGSKPEKPKAEKPAPKTEDLPIDIEDQGLPF